MQNHKPHFINKEKFSIRKFTIGTASIILGTFLYLVQPGNVAQAEENAQAQPTSSTVDNRQTSNETTQPTTNNAIQSNPSDSPQTNETSSKQDNTSTETTNAKTNSPSKSVTIEYQAQKDGSNEVSHMDEYMEHPAKAFKENDKYFFQVELKNASWWQEFSFFDKEGNELANHVVVNDKAKNKKTVNIEVKPGLKTINSKIHIIVPGIGYDHKYKTHIELKEAIPTIEDPQTNNTAQNTSNQKQNTDKQNNGNQDNTNQNNPNQNQNNTNQNNGQNGPDKGRQKQRNGQNGPDNEKQKQNTNNQNDCNKSACNVNQNHVKDCYKNKQHNSNNTENKKSNAKHLPNTGIQEHDELFNITIGIVALFISLLLFISKDRKLQSKSKS